PAPMPSRSLRRKVKFLRTQPAILVADIGGTKTRLALSRGGGLGAIKSDLTGADAKPQPTSKGEIFAHAACHPCRRYWRNENAARAQSRRCARRDQIRSDRRRCQAAAYVER